MRLMTLATLQKYSTTLGDEPSAARSHLMGMFVVRFTHTSHHSLSGCAPYFHLIRAVQGGKAGEAAMADSRSKLAAAAEAGDSDIQFTLGVILTELQETDEAVRLLTLSTLQGFSTLYEARLDDFERGRVAQQALVELLSVSPMDPFSPSRPPSHFSFVLVWKCRGRGRDRKQ